MTKFIQAFLTGIFFTFILDFFLFLGIKQGYIEFYEIDLYYNILFADHQNIFLYSIFSVLIGYIVIYVNNNKLSLIVVSFLFLLSLSTLIQGIGYSLGEMMFFKQNVTYKDSRYNFRGDVYYEGRTKITFYDYELKKTILLNKKDLKQ